MSKVEMIEVPVTVLRKMAKYDRTARKILKEYFNIPPARQSTNLADKLKASDLAEKTFEELVEMGKEAGLKSAHKMSRESLIESLTSDKII